MKFRFIFGIAGGNAFNETSFFCRSKSSDDSLQNLPTLGVK